MDIHGLGEDIVYWSSGCARLLAYDSLSELSGDPSSSPSNFVAGTTSSATFAVPSTYTLFLTQRGATAPNTYPVANNSPPFTLDTTSSHNIARDQGSTYLESRSNAPESRLASTTTTTAPAPAEEKRNEVGPQSLAAKMEGSGQTAIAAPAPPSSSLHALNHHHHDHHMQMISNEQQLGEMAFPADMDNNNTSASKHTAAASTTPSKPQAANHANESQQQWLPNLDTPVHTTNHGIESNIRDTADLYGPELMDRVPLPSMHAHHQDATAMPQRHVEPSTPSVAAAPSTSNFAADDEEQSTQAFAKLEFPDSYALITTTHLMVVRDRNHQASWERQKKEEKKRRRAERDMEAYAREPSHHSQYDVDELCGPTDEDLVGRIKPSLLSNFSESGGPVAFVDPGEEAEELSSRGKRKKNNSSSNHSIAPLSLHDFDRDQLATEAYVGENRYADTDPSQWAQLPIHTPRPEDIKKISREHLLFRYSSEQAKWVMDVVGNQIVVASANGHREDVYGRGTTDIVLNHEDEIFISTVRFRFILPAELVEESSEEEDESDDVLETVESLEDATAATSPAARRISDLVDSVESGEEDEAEAKQKSRPKIKLKVGKSSGTQLNEKTKSKHKGKGKGKEPAASSKKPSSVEKTVPNVKAEQDGTSAAPEQKPSQSAEPRASQASPAGPPPALDPTSAYAAVDPSQYPEKRKGPGRPPKNGLLSKRDDAGVKRKTKEYERQGIPLPPLNELLAIVRQEQKQKDAAAKAQQRGEPVPETVMHNPELPGPHVPPAPGPSQTTSHVQTQTHGSGSPSEIPAQRAMSPRPPRRAKSPSPMPLESHYTEEQLKKPNMTYIYLLDEILQNVDGGQADLQTIYDRIQKRWPFFKYKVTSQGWQSSVRHNLLSCERFVESGKSGKGKFWRINTAHELDAKKRRPSPPPRPPMPMHNGQMQYSQNPYGAAPYNSTYGTHPHNQNSGAHAHGSNNYSGSYNNAGLSGGIPPPHSAQNHNGSYSRPPLPSGTVPQPTPPPRPRTAFEILVAEIVEFQNRWLAQFSGDEKQSRGDFLNAAVTAVETYVKKQNATAERIDTEDMDFSQEPFKSLKSIFERHMHAISNLPQPQAPAQGAATTNANNPVQAAAAPAQTTPSNAPPSTSDNQSSMPAPTPAPGAPTVQQQPTPPQAQPTQANSTPQASHQAAQSAVSLEPAPAQTSRPDSNENSKQVNGLPRPTSAGIKRAADDEGENDAKRAKIISEEPKAAPAVAGVE